MDVLLLDIKNFLKKLEHGQLDIEAGQWELHKDISNMKRTVEDLKKLKEDVEVMRINNAEQMGLIKNLENKLELIYKNYSQDQPVTETESSIEYETLYRRQNDTTQAPKGYKKRKCHLVRSEEIIEITSEMSDKKSGSEVEESGSRGEGSTVEKADDNDQASEDISQPSPHKKHVHISPTERTSKVRYQSHPTILQRYLKDSVKYRDRKISTSDSCGTLTEPSVCGVMKKDTEYNNFWDEYSSRAPPTTMYPNRQSSRQNSSSSENARTTESVIPKRLICPKNLKKFNFKSDFPEQERRSRSVRYIYHCKVCGKGFSTRDLARAHEANHKEGRKAKGFKCSYCDKVCSTPQKLTLHLKNCRIVMRSHFKRRFDRHCPAFEPACPGRQSGKGCAFVVYSNK